MKRHVLSLRGLFAGIGLAGLALAPISYWLAHEREKASVIEYLSQVGIDAFRLKSPGGSFHFEVIVTNEWKGDAKDLLLLADLGEVASVDFTIHSNLSPEAFENLAKIESLKFLYAFGTNICDSDLQSFGKCDSLEEIDLSLTKINGKGLQFLSQLPNLRRLDVSSSDAKIIRLSDFPVLSELDVQNCSKLSELSLTQLPKIASLDLTSVHPKRSLRLVSLMALKDAALSIDETESVQLRDLPALCHLEVSSARPEIIRDIARLPKIKSLTIWGGEHVSDPDLETISSLPHLESLTLRFAPISDDGCRVFSKMEKLRHLNLSYSSIDSSVINYLNSDVIEELNLEGIDLDEHSLKVLGTFPKLKLLRANLPSDGIENLPKNVQAAISATGEL